MIEGQRVMAGVQVMSGVTLDRDISVTVHTGDGSARGVENSLLRYGYLHAISSHSQWLMVTMRVCSLT